VLNLARVGKERATFDEEDRQLARDLADRAALAIDNARLRAELELRVLERTIELEAANQELEAFAYSVSHDLREPLRAIDGFSRALQVDCGHQLDQKGLHYVERVRAGARRMSTLIDDLLQLSRVGRAQMNKAPVDLSALALLVLEELQRNAPERRVVAQVAPGLDALGDARLLRIVVDNLLGNAWKFTSNRAEARINVGRERKGDEDVFFVRDDGAGFDMAYRDKLFSPFQRLHRVSEFDGTGVGLATVQRIVRRHGGRIWAEGRVDEGAVFFFTLREPGAAGSEAP
jgi:light-regulated signal transduction histidine kinase (bacteriophytochrome)